MQDSKKKLDGYYWGIGGTLNFEVKLNVVGLPFAETNTAYTRGDVFIFRYGSFGRRTAGRREYTVVLGARGRETAKRRYGRNQPKKAGLAEFGFSAKNYEYTDIIKVISGAVD